MQVRALGRNGRSVSAIGIGGMSFCDVYGATNQDESHALLHAALELGVDHIDTSNVYGRGRSENVIGAFLRGFNGPNPFAIATKAGIVRGAGPDEKRFENSRAHLEAELDASLLRLGVERVDLFYVHRRDQTIPIEDVTETLAGFVRAGKIAAFGYSEIAPSSLRRACVVHPVAAVQSEYSLATRTPEVGLVQGCEDLGAALVAFSPVGRGLLTDLPPTLERAAGSSLLRTMPRFNEDNLAANLRQTDAFRAVAVELGVSAASLAIAWLLRQGPHVIPIPGTRSVQHLRELAAGANLTLSKTDLALVETVLPSGWAHGDRYSEAQWEGPERYA